MNKNDSRYTERRERVYTFFKQPFEIEKMMIYGWLLCLDVILHVFTFLPLRAIYACIKLILAPISWIRGKSCMDTALKCDIIKSLIFIFGLCLLSKIDTSFIYHLVRAQTLIKLYIIYNMLEVADRLFSSFGQDILDALFFTVTESTKKKREPILILVHFILAVGYTVIHATLVLFQATTLNVAFNSHSKVLLTIMMANNFVEIKGTVFKKYDKNNLFQISCADIRERFLHFALNLVVLFRNMQQYSWSYDHFLELLPNMVIVMLVEHFIDWFKHAFVVKFNHIPTESYNEFRATLAYDVASSRRKGSLSDHSDIVTRRLGFIPLPLAVLIFHVARISIDFSGRAGALAIILIYVILSLLKLLNNIIIVGKAVVYIEQDRLASTTTLTSPKLPRKTPSTSEKSPELSIVDPFEQRGNRTIIVPKPLRSRLDVGEGDFRGRSPIKKQEELTKFTSPAKERSLRLPSVDHIVAAGTSLTCKDDNEGTFISTTPPFSRTSTDPSDLQTSSESSSSGKSLQDSPIKQLSFETISETSN